MQLQRLLSLHPTDGCCNLPLMQLKASVLATICPPSGCCVLSGTLADLKLLLVDHVHGQLLALDPAQLVAALLELLVQQLLGEALPLPLSPGCQRAGALCQFGAALLRGPAAAEQLLLQCLQEGLLDCANRLRGCLATASSILSRQIQGDDSDQPDRRASRGWTWCLEVLSKGRRQLELG